MNKEEMHRIAAGWFALKKVKGDPPCTHTEGALDGLEYYEVTIDGNPYWLTQRGLTSPAAGHDSENS